MRNFFIGRMVPSPNGGYEMEILMLREKNNLLLPFHNEGINAFLESILVSILGIYAPHNAFHLWAAKIGEGMIKKNHVMIMGDEYELCFLPLGEARHYLNIEVPSDVFDDNYLSRELFHLSVPHGGCCFSAKPMR